MTIYPLAFEEAALLEMLEQLPEDEEERALQEQAIHDTLEMVHEDFKDKANSYGKILRQIQADAEACKAEKLRLAARQSSLEKNAERLKNAMKQAMLIIGMKNLKTDLFTYSTRSSQEVHVDAASIYELPDDMVRYSDPVPDKAAIKKYIKEHPEEEIPWAHLEETQSLIVK